ncbi:MAG: hypothetical protein ABI199_01605 [Bacteroidia bacterium]
MNPFSLFFEFQQRNSSLQKAALFILMFSVISLSAEAGATSTAGDDGSQSQVLVYAISAVGLIAVIALAWFLTTHDFSEKPAEHKRPKMQHKPRR